MTLTQGPGVLPGGPAMHWVPGAGTSRVYTAIRMVSARDGFSC